MDILTKEDVIEKMEELRDILSGYHPIMNNIVDILHATINLKRNEVSETIDNHDYWVMNKEDIRKLSIACNIASKNIMKFTNRKH